MNILNRTLPAQLAHEFFTTVITVKLPVFTFLISTLTILGITMVGTVDFLERWYWEPLITLPLFFISYFVDLYMAMVLNGRLQHKAIIFDTFKFQVFLVKFIGVVLMVGLLHAMPMMAKYMMEFQGAHPENVKMVHHVILGAVWLAFISLWITQIISALANGAKAGVWKYKWALWVVTHVDLHKASIYDTEERKKMFIDMYKRPELK
jgi:hypothetical protein